MEEILVNRRGGGDLFLIIVSVLGYPKKVGGLSFNFLHRGGFE